MVIMFDVVELEFYKWFFGDLLILMLLLVFDIDIVIVIVVIVVWWNLKMIVDLVLYFVDVKFVVLLVF